MKKDGRQGKGPPLTETKPSNTYEEDAEAHTRRDPTTSSSHAPELPIVEDDSCPNELDDSDESTIDYRGENDADDDEGDDVDQIMLHGASMEESFGVLERDVAQRSTRPMETYLHAYGTRSTDAPVETPMPEWSRGGGESNAT